MQDAVIVLALSLSLATFLTSYVATAYGLLYHHPRWRAAVALAFPPMGVVWGHGAGMRLRPRAMVVSAVVYVVARLIAK